MAAIAFVGCVDCAAINNTIVDPEHWVLRILLWAYLAAIYSAAFFLAHSWIDVCAIIGSTIATIAQFFRSQQEEVGRGLAVFHHRGGE